MLGSQVPIQVIVLLSSVAIARLISPRELGLARMALVFTTLALVLVDFGITSAIVQRPVLTDDDRSTAFWVALAVGVVCLAAGVGLSWPIADLFGEHEVQPLLAAGSLVLLLTSAALVPTALLRRQMAFRALQLCNITGVACGAAAGIAMAALGAGPWAVVGQSIATALVAGAAQWRSARWRPRAVVSRESVRRTAGYTSQVFGSRLLSWGIQNLDNVLVGRFLGAAALGAYSIAYGVIVTPSKRLSSPLNSVFFSAFSRSGDDSRIATMWMRALRLVAVVVTPAMLGVMAVAPDLVAVVFGSRWHAATAVMVILAPVGLMLALQGLNVAIIQAVAHTAALLRFTIVQSAATVAAFAVGLLGGIRGVAAAFLVVSLVFEPLYLRMTARAIGLPLREWLRAVAGSLQAGVGMVVVVLAARLALVAAGLPPAARLAVCVVLGAAVYLPLIRWREPVGIEQLRGLLAGARGGTRPTEPVGAGT